MLKENGHEKKDMTLVKINNRAKGREQAKIENFVLWKHLAGQNTYFVHNTHAFSNENQLKLAQIV